MDIKYALYVVAARDISIKAFGYDQVKNRAVISYFNKSIEELTRQFITDFNNQEFSMSSLDYYLFLTDETNGIVLHY